MSHARRITASILLAITVFGVLPIAPFGQVREVRAAVFTFETNTELLAAVGVSAAEDTAITLQVLYEWAQSFVLESLKKRLLDMMVDQIVEWIQGGGKPQFVTDWNGFLSKAANDATGDFIQEIGYGFLCSPFNFHVQLYLNNKKFTEQVTCTLDQVVANVDNFFADFRNGGWVGYSLFMEPKNNYYGASLLAEADLERRKANAQIAAQNEALSGGGFLSTKDCQEGGGGGPDIDGDGTPGDIRSTCTVTTPGDTVGNLVSKAVGSDIDYIVNAEQLSAYVSAIANAVINRVIIEGVKGLQGLGTPNAPPGGFVGGGAAGNCNGLTGAVLNACLSLVNVSQNSFASAKFKILQDIQNSRAARQSVDTSYQSTIAALTTYTASLQNLLTQFQTLSCQNVQTCNTKISNELAFATSSVPSVQNNATANQSVIAQLNNFEVQVNAVAQDDWAALSSLMNQMQQSNAANYSAAVNLDVNAKQALTDTQDRIAQTMQRFNSYLLQCQQGSPLACL